MNVRFRAIADAAWTGDPWGNEWRLSWVVVAGLEEPGAPLWQVYTDDQISPVTGYRKDRRVTHDVAGNGDFEGGFDDFEEACRFAVERAKLADERGF